ncbi:MAG: methylamine dehydrogenase (amicyanin) light chain [Alphaproteobacteria bacterium]|nr:MAG: methylamine dehydrogenase (amicyanin) light chain [Alphaproteobacteria bacterium]
MKRLDSLTEKLVRGVARRSSRRGFMGLLGGALVGQLAIPVLPVSRAAAMTPEGGADGNGYDGVTDRPTNNPEDPGDPTGCDYWRYCGIDGFLCTCCGGSTSSCPPGTEMSPITWVGTCLNPGDGRRYVISYNDCCGINSCGRCLCNRNENDTPMVRPQSNNDINWCVGSESTVYNCSTAVIIGLDEG